MGQVLVVEDDETIGGILRSALATGGHVPRWSKTGTEALAAARDQQFDLVLLDLGLPDLDGVEVCTRLKTIQPGTVVVMLTARRDEMDVVAGLEAGADDYLMKPFRMIELLARVRAHLRRATTDVNAQPIEVGDLVIDPQARRCLVRDREVSLRPKEFDLLLRLAEPVGTAVSREALISDVWDENWYGSTKTLDVHIASLRRQLAQAAGLFDPPARLPVVSTLRGHGYRLDAPDPDEC